MYILDKQLWFPEQHLADKSGLLAIGGDLSFERLLLAYQNGIFPWYNEGQPILWHSPDPRMVLFPEELKVHKSMRQLLRKEVFEVTINTDFEAVINACAVTPRVGQDDTWITDAMITAYMELHELGHAVSVEVWKEGQLVGGLYGIDLPEQKVFCGESMFSTVSNASKIAFVTWVQQLRDREYKLIDCQVYTDHLASLGGREIPRAAFLQYLSHEGSQ